MRNLIQAALSISIILAVLSLLMIVIGWSNPTQPELFQYLTQCNGLPCYLGVVPGETTWTTAQKIFETIPELQFDISTRTVHQPIGFKGSLEIFNTQDVNTISEIELFLQLPSVSIGSIILRLGAPCAVDRFGSQLRLTFPGMSVRLYPSLLNPNTLVEEIGLNNRLESCDQLPENLANHPWRGFALYTK